MHTGDSRFDYSNPNRLVPILEIYSDLIIVGAHMGAWSLWDEAAEKLAGMTFDVVADFIAFVPEHLERDYRLFKK